MRAQRESQENLQTAQQYFFHVDWILQFQFLKLQVWKIIITTNIRDNCNSLPHMATNSNANLFSSTLIVRQEYQQWQLHNTRPLLTIPH